MPNAQTCKIIGETFAKNSEKNLATQTSKIENLAIGVDIVTISRIAKIFTKYKNKFAQKILSPQEFTEFNQAKNSVNFLAKRFATKEAAVKVLGTGFTQGISFGDISLQHQKSGMPYLEFSGKFAEIAQAKNLTNWQISLSDTDDLVIAFIVAI